MTKNRPIAKENNYDDVPILESSHIETTDSLLMNVESAS